MNASAEICRSCLSTDGDFLCIESFIDGSMKISDCLKVHLNVNIAIDDGLPQQICLDCIDGLLQIREFHLRYLRSEEYLLEQYVESCVESDILQSIPSINIGKEPNFCISGVKNKWANVDSSEPSPLKAEKLTIRSGIKPKLGNFKEEYDPLSEVNCVSQDEDQNAKGKVQRRSNCKQNIDDSENNPAKTIANKFNPNSIFCLQCYQPFENRNELRNHFHSMHEEDNARGFCTQCSTILPNRGALMNHLYAHSLTKTRLTCNYCGRTFGSREKVVCHERTHTGEKPYICKVCGRGFSQSSVLGTHMSLHTGKTIECPRCDKKFSRNSFLKVHLRVHDDIRLYVCHVCDKKYQNNSHLKSHLASHSNERNFPCKECGQSFKTKGFLRTHMNIHTRPYKCPECTMQAANLNSFRIHLVKIHGIHDDPNLYKKPTKAVDDY